MDGWIELDDARELWPTDLDDEQLALYLDVAARAVEEFAPALTGADFGDDESLDFTAPRHWRLAQVMHARNLYNAARASASTGDFGDGSYAITTRPLDWHVKQILRPQRGRPVVG